MSSFLSLLALLACSAVANVPFVDKLVCGQPPAKSSAEWKTAQNDELEPTDTARLADRARPATFDAEPARRPLAEPIFWARGHTTTYVPSGFVPEDGTYDMLVHFHGVPTRMRPAFQAAGFDHAVLVTVNLGLGSGPYEERFALPAAFPQLLASIERAMDEREATRGLKRGRLALSGWSAGYGAIKQVLAQPAVRDGVDAVLLADGLHAGFVGPYGRTIHALRMAPFVAFAEQAVQGSKLLAIAHSAIRTTTYASTTETARYLAAALGLQTGKADGQRVGSMEMTSRVEQRGFRVHGFAGSDANAHVDHLAHIDETLLGQLRTWWNGGASVADSNANAQSGS
ncbi:MAG: hypothetical protein MUF54_10195 [Polyangiaceae bacterium]|jgi:hypothetical protein|nr:hypothetical protein [Polyangiaceae bacterium]